MYYTQTNITEGFEYKLAEAIKKAIKSNSEDSLMVILGFIKKVLNDSANEDSNLFRIFKTFPSFIFYTSKLENKQHGIIEELSKILVDIICFKLIRSLENANNKQEIIDINSFIDLGYTGYSQLIFKTLNLSDENSFKTAIDNLYIRKYMLKTNEDFRILPSYLKEKHNSLDFEIKYIEELELLKHGSNTFRRLQFAIFAWICNLIKCNIFSIEEANRYLKCLKHEFVKPEDLISDLIYYNSYDYEIFDWHNWDIEERKELEVYDAPIQPRTWLTFAFALYTLKYNDLLGFNIDKFDSNEIYRWLPNDLKDKFIEISKDIDKWRSFIWQEGFTESMTGDESELFNRKRDNILSPFYLLKNKLEQKEISIISNQDLSTEKVGEFKNKFFNMFINNSVFLKAFEIFKNLYRSEVPASGSEKITTSIDINFIKAKIMFVETKHQHIYGAEEFGGNMARNFDNKIFKKLISMKTPIEYLSITEGLDNSIEYINSIELKPSLIFIDIKLTFNFYKFKGFIPNWKNNENNFRYLIGEYKGLKVFTTHCSNLKDSFVVCDFKNAFQATELISENFHKNILDINVSSIDDKIAEDIYNKETENWRITEDGIKLSKTESLELIKLNVKITSSYEMNLDKINSDSFVIGKINKDITTPSLKN